MSFIDKALERAQAARQKDKPKVEEDIKAPWAENSRKPLPVAGSVGYAGPVKDICYTTTKTYPVDMKLLAKNYIIVGDEFPDITEEYKLLRTHIIHKTKKNNYNTIMFTSPQLNEGKTLTTLNIAISIAQEIDKTVLLVDTDLRNPTIHRYLGLSPRRGLVDYLKDGIPIPELLIHPEGIDKMVVLPAGRATGDAAELIKSPQMVDLVQELKHCYEDRYVLFDLPPLLSYADALAFAPLMDCIVMVVEAGRTRCDQIEQGIEMLKDFNLLGLVLNKVKKKDQGSYYDYYQSREPKKSKFRIFG
ncbi:nucleotide-binding protein [Desulfobacca acetoxidans]|uniref:Capsular exopolysaccharide family n=1 Tax=Desulfobacca acetoxidans (strain ATCC 700848 / DSM 11109 / ASRB2) TaxID=880072 RepID=F2NEE9_DESAR|nr:capsular exopolysaccharide family protein [Desulfobacca acetoxidans]AEB08139.1 capsular exopolysaccharide family [Desulfobacca acetoxidans DSM 11109]